jgi:hypothetical protein
MAGSSPQGIFVAPSTNTPSMLFPTPCIYTRNSVFTRREDSFSPEKINGKLDKNIIFNDFYIINLERIIKNKIPSDRLPVRESISSINIILGFLSLAI